MDFTFAFELAFSSIDGSALGRAATVSSKWRDTIACKEELFQDLLENEFGLAATKATTAAATTVAPPETPSGGSCSSFRASYVAWRLWRRNLGLSVDQMPSGESLGPIAVRARRLWGTFEDWFTRRLPEVASTFVDHPGVKKAKWRKFEEVLFGEVLEVAEDPGSIPLPGLALLRLLYDTHDGQDIVHARSVLKESGEPASDSNSEAFHGILGG